MEIIFIERKQNVIVLLQQLDALSVWYVLIFLGVI